MEESADAHRIRHPIKPISDAEPESEQHNIGGVGHRLWLRLRLAKGARAGSREARLCKIAALPICPNLFFLGLHWMHTFKSGFLFGVGDDAAYLADYILGIKELSAGEIPRVHGAISNAGRRPVHCVGLCTAAIPHRRKHAIGS